MWGVAGWLLAWRLVYLWHDQLVETRHLIEDTHIAFLRTVAALRGDD